MSLCLVFDRLNTQVTTLITVNMVLLLLFDLLPESPISCPVISDTVSSIIIIIARIKRRVISPGEYLTGS